MDSSSPSPCRSALEYLECMADDVKPGKYISFPQSGKLKPGEEVWFPWIVYKLHRQRDQIMKKVMTNPRIASFGPDNMPFDGTRLLWGGFKKVVTSG